MDSHMMIDEKKAIIKPGMTIWEAAKENGIDIPTLCHRPDLTTKGNCRVCVVEIEGETQLMPSCSTSAKPGMRIQTNTPRVASARRTVVELLLSNHNRNCAFCEKNKICDLQELADQMNILQEAFDGVYQALPQEQVDSFMAKEPDKCIRCRRCVDVCSAFHKIRAFGVMGRGCQMNIGCAFDTSIKETLCIQCGKCIEVCPTASLYTQKHLFPLWGLLDSPEKHVIAFMDPHESLQLDKTAGYDTVVPLTAEKVAGFLKKIGIKCVFDGTAGAAMAAADRFQELDERKKANLPLPVLVSDDPAVLRYINRFYPEDDQLISKVKPALAYLGQHLKDWYAREFHIARENIAVVAITRQLSNKTLVDAPERLRDLDIVLTPQEVTLLIKQTMYILDEIQPVSLIQSLTQLDSREDTRAYHPPRILDLSFFEENRKKIRIDGSEMVQVVF